MYYFFFISRSRSPSRASANRRRRRTSSNSSASSGSKQSSSSSSRRPRSPDYGGNPNLIPIGGRGKSSPRGKVGSGGPSGSGLYKPPQLKRKMLRTKRNGAEDVDNDDGSDVPYFYTDGKKKMTLDADMASTEKRQKRAAR